MALRAKLYAWAAFAMYALAGAAVATAANCYLSRHKPLAVCPIAVVQVSYSPVMRGNYVR